MKIIDDFVICKNSVLNSPATDDDICRLTNRLKDNGEELVYLYKTFDGEKFSNSPSLIWFDICSIPSLFDYFESMDEIWADIECMDQLLEDTYPMRGFAPFMHHVDFKTDIGPIYSEGSPYNGYVIEYNAEGGEFRVWSKSLKDFIEAFFSYVISVYPSEEDYMTDDGEYVLSEKSKIHFSQWPNVVYPFIESNFIPEENLIKNS